ncbi:MAG: FlgD immunoglobulin-like domain containing protein [Candidatus Eisenbacteria bacterium]
MRLGGIPVLPAVLLILVGCFASVLVPAVSVATVRDVTIFPPRPSICDSTGLHASGYFPDACWHYDGYDIMQLPTMALTPYGPQTVYRLRIFCHWDSAMACATVLVPYDVTHFFGNLPAGPYMVFAVEVDSRDTLTVYDQRSLSFSVTDACGPPPDCVMPGFAPLDNACHAVVFPGRPGALTVTLNNAMPLAGAQMKINGFRRFRDTVCPGATRCGSEVKVVRVEPVMRARDMGLEWSFSGETLHFMLHPLSSESSLPGIIEPGDGPVVRVWIEVVVDSALRLSDPTAWIPEFSFPVTLEPVAFADENGRSVPACPTFAPITGNICIRDGVKCDVNGDGRADVVDIVRMIKCIICPIPEGCCTPEETEKGDCNGDGVLTVNDVVCCIRYILAGRCDWCAREQVDGPLVSTAEGSLSLPATLTAKKGEDLVVPVSFSSPSEPGGLEVRLRYDPGLLAVKGVRLGEELSDCELFYDARDGSLSLMVVSMSSGRLPSGSGVLASVTFTATGEPSGTEISLDGVVGSDGEGSRLDFGSSNARTVVQSPGVAPFSLASAPNPFSGSTEISFSSDVTQRVTLSVFDVAGRLVRLIQDGALDSGVHHFAWDGRDGTGSRVPSGIYFLKVNAERGSLSKKLVLLNVVR